MEHITQDPKATLQSAISLARNSPPKPTNFRVGAILASLEDGRVTAHGYTLELPGNTHAEECCLLKLAEQHAASEEDLARIMHGRDHALYTTVEPCFRRLSGKMPCVQRILRQRSWIKTVYVGVREPETFVGANPGMTMLQDAGVHVIFVPGLEDEILGVATAGHEDPSP